jgi:iron complex outermembrane recepter protein
VSRARIEVLAAAPVDGVGLPLEEIPAEVTRVQREPGQDAVSAIAAAVPSLQFNDAQHNRLQRDVQLRGFTASPLLGLPQGLAVYSDGVRLNEPFGDVVNWDLLPDVAIEEIDVLQGSNPLFGLNALGGVISVRTRSGLTGAAASAHAATGSLGSSELEADQAWLRGEAHGYFGASLLHDEGWRHFSRSSAAQGFLKVGRAGTRSTGHVSLSLADTDLRGNGPAPVQLLDLSRRAVFTHPDRTANRALSLTGHADWTVSPRLIAEAALFVRTLDTRRLNGDDSPFEPCDSDPALLCEEDSDEPVLSAGGSAVPSVVNGRLLDAVDNRSRTRSGTAGGTAQLQSQLDTGAVHHRLLAGVSFEASDIDFSSAVELASFDSTRATVGQGITATAGAVDLESTTSLLGVYLRDTVALGDRTSVSAVLRFHRAELRIRDLIGTALDGDHLFHRLNGSLGATWQMSPQTTLYASAGESSRAPTAVELTCADPEEPCRLPNAFLSDPPLRQVVARTWEVGARGRSGTVAWSAAAFDARNRNDIIFIASGVRLGEGYFANVGSTGRRGAEMFLDASLTSRAGWRLSYAWLDARFLTPLRMPSPNHPLEEEEGIDVARGARIPGLAEHTAKLALHFPFPGAVSASVTGLWQSPQHFRGDEANLLDPLPAFVRWDSRLDWKATQRLRVSVIAENLFDRRYATFGALGEPDDVLGDEFDDPRFVSPGAPRSVRLAVRWQLDR